MKKLNFKQSPTIYYAMSIGASWAGAGSLMNSTTMANSIGILPALTWVIFNTLACIVFGVLIWHLPTVRELMRTKACRVLLAIFSAFQLWLAMTAVHDAWAETPIGSTGGLILTYAAAVFFWIIMFVRGIWANILTDDGGMLVIYALVIVLAVAAAIMTGGNFASLPLGLEKENMLQGLYKGILLLPGPFTYPYFFKLADYNEQNEDGVSKADIKKAFIGGGLAFGAYMVFAFSLIFTTVSPVLNIVKAILLTALAISTMSSFIYGKYAVFGKKGGAAISALAIAFWIFVKPLGVMGVWTLMAELRAPLVILLLLAAVSVKVNRKREGGEAK